MAKRKKTPPKDKAAEREKRRWFMIRDTIASLHGIEAARRYDAYLKEHSERLRQLMQIADDGYGTGNSYIR
jgi:hypothetical protein